MISDSRQNISSNRERRMNTVNRIPTSELCPSAGLISMVSSRRVVAFVEMIVDQSIDQSNGCIIP